VSAAVSLVVVALGYLSTYRTNRRLNERQDQLSRVNSQLSELYGPLLLLVSADTATWDAFSQKYMRDREFFFEGKRSADELVLWRTWVTAVWMPTNRRFYDTLVSHGDLIVDDVVPKVFLDFCAHVQSFEAVLARWADGDVSQLSSLLNHPGEPLLRHIEERYLSLKRYQTTLLATTRARS
jgi:hypothetical protein